MNAMDDRQRSPRQDTSEHAPADRTLSDDTPRIDWRRALEATAGDEQLLVEVLGAFREEAPMLLDNIRASIKNRDAELLHRAAHTIKNAFYSLGSLDR